MRETGGAIDSSLQPREIDPISNLGAEFINSGLIFVFRVLIAAYRRSQSGYKDQPEVSLHVASLHLQIVCHHDVCTCIYSFRHHTQTVAISERSARRRGIACRQSLGQMNTHLRRMRSKSLCTG